MTTRQIAPPEGDPPKEVRAAVAQLLPGDGRQICKAAVARFEPRWNPMDGIVAFSTRMAKMYTKEEPNALNPRTEVPEFLARLKARFPQWYAFAFTGFVLGQRPSTLRPLRRKGPNADLGG